MLRPGVTQEWVDEGELPRERTKNRRWRRPYDVLAEATRGEVVVRVRESVCNEDVTRRRHSAADRGGIVCGNAMQAIMSREGQDHANRRLFRVCASKLASDESLGVISIWGLCTTEGEVRLQVLVKLLGRHSGVEAGGRKGRGSDDESSGAQLPKNKASVRKEVGSEERHNAAEADLLIAKEGMKMQGNG
ncbi:hypothetical protein B296_00027481 [Ensete ventricosum]|uniref:Uncharacterized protein n=1 Tax=Ensete ventricosum TaxID=4639 RepID=A0A426YL30_ENSVE|nr:hypothetical protein B296_00027481 [Ensete ventricosum]